MTVNQGHIKFILIVGALLFWSIAFYEGIYTATKVWSVSEIYNHCFIVLPATIYFIYLKRADVNSVQWRPNLFLLAPILSLLFIQMFAQIGDIKILMHIAAFTALPLLIWGILGNQAAKAIAFPLFFIVFCIPIGDQLIPALQEITTDIAVPMLELTGVPVYRNGLFLDIPEGRFLVAEACSGISFLITSIVFGFMYSYFSYHEYSKRFLFICLSVIVPILANAIRVYGIVLTGHLTDMEHAVGADHLVYGGVFFGLVLFILILIGEWLRSKNSESCRKTSNVSKENTLTVDKRIGSYFLVSLTIMLAFEELTIARVEGNNPINDKKIVDLESSTFDFQTQKLRYWSPVLVNPTQITEGKVVNETNSYDYFSAYFNGSDSELIASNHRLFDDNNWTLLVDSSNKITNANIRILEVISQSGAKRYIAYWYNVDGKYFSNRSKAKLYQTFQKLVGNDSTGSIVMLSAEKHTNNEQSAEQLVEFITQHTDELIAF